MKRSKILLFLVISLIWNVRLPAQNIEEKKIQLLPVQNIMDHAFKKSRVVMMNEAHSGQKRNIRTRIIGQLVLPTAHSNGVRHMAIEALDLDTAFVRKANQTRKVPDVKSEFGYLIQPEMRRLIQTALDLGWTLVNYEADRNKRPELKSSLERSNWRELEQAKNLSKTFDELDEEAKLLVWCGNSHHSKESGSTPGGALFPMGYQFWKITGIEPFVIDQIITVDVTGNNSRFQKWNRFEAALKKNFYGTLGFISGEKDAKIISIHNKLE